MERCTFKILFLTQLLPSFDIVAWTEEDVVRILSIIHAPFWLMKKSPFEYAILMIKLSVISQARMQCREGRIQCNSERTGRRDT